MARPPLDIDSHGEIRYEMRGERVYARGNYRGKDGKTHERCRSGSTENAAKRRLMAAFRELREGSDEQLTFNSRVRAAGAIHFDKLARLVRADALSPGTYRLYESVWRNHVEPRCGDIRLVEFSVQRAERILHEIADEASLDLAATARVVLGAAMRQAVKYGAVPSNVVRDVDRLPPPVREDPKALTPEQIGDLVLKLSLDPKARERHIPDLTLWMLATSERIGNALAASWDRIDLETRRADVGPNVIRKKGKVGEGGGLVIRGADRSTKTRSRILELPNAAVHMLRNRWLVYGQSDTGLVFPNAWDSGPIDPSNIGKAMKAAFTRAGYPDLTSHVMRKTVATTLDRASIDSLRISQVLGHRKRAMTEERYIARLAHAPEITAALDAVLPVPRSLDATVTPFRPRGWRDNLLGDPREDDQGQSRESG